MKPTITLAAIALIASATSSAQVFAPEPVASYFNNSYGQPVQLIIYGRNTADKSNNQRLLESISNALAKKARIKSEGCAQAFVNINPGNVKRSQVLATIRQVRPGVRPLLKIKSDWQINARWNFKGEIQRLCLFLEGRGHAKPAH